MRMTMIHVPLSRIHFKLHLKSFIYRVASEEARGCNVRELFTCPYHFPSSRVLEALQKNCLGM